MVLVGVEPHSLVWFVGKKADDRRGSTWFAELQPWSSLRRVVCDAGTGLQAGIAQLRDHRRESQTDPVPLEKGLDVFHTQREARRVLRTVWNRAERLWEQAEVATRAVERERRQGRDARGPARTAFAAWCKAEAAFRRAEQAEAGWKRAEPALNLFRPDGLLNDRSWAREQIASALPLLSDPEWSKVRGLLQAPESLTFLDQLHDQLGRLEVPEASRRPGGVVAVASAAASRRGAARGKGLSPGGCTGARGPLPEDRPGLAGGVPGGGVGVESGGAPSSAVEGMNSVLRMHQSRHRTLNQGLLDLKRLYWNTRVFGGGKRRGRCPYEHLGLRRPSYRFWDLLEGEMTIALVEAKAKARSKRPAA